MQLKFYNLCSRRVLLPALFSALSLQSGTALGADGQVGQAIAAAISGAAPAVEAAIQASADKEIAKTNANAQIEMTNIQADLSKYQSDSTKEIAQFQSVTAQAINKQNNDHQTDNLLEQLRYKAFDRELTRESEVEKRRDEFALNEQRIALAYKQADAQFALSQATLQAQLTQAGLSTGFVTRSAGNNLSVSNVFGAHGNPGLMPQPMQSVASMRPGPMMGRNGFARSRLFKRLPNMMERARERVRQGGGVQLASMGSQLYNVFGGNLSQGSSRWSHRTSEESDLSHFQATVREGGELTRHARSSEPEMAASTHSTHGSR